MSTLERKKDILETTRDIWTQSGCWEIDMKELGWILQVCQWHGDCANKKKNLFDLCLMKSIFLSSPFTLTLKATWNGAWIYQLHCREMWHNMPDYFKIISLSLREMCTQIFVGKWLGVWNVLQNTPGKKTGREWSRGHKVHQSMIDMLKPGDRYTGFIRVFSLVYVWNFP